MATVLGTVEPERVGIGDRADVLVETGRDDVEDRPDMSSSSVGSQTGTIMV